MTLTNLMLPLTIMVASQMIAIAVACLLAPRLSRPDIFFSITVDPSLRTSVAGREILRQFSRSIILSCMAGLLLVLAAACLKLDPETSVLLLASGFVLELAVIIKSYTTARRRVTPHHMAASTQREAAVSPHRPFLTGGWLGQAGPFVILGVACLWLWLRWDEIPARFPIHWGMDGRPNGWGTRSFGDIFLTPLIGMFICVFFAALLNGLARGVRRIHSSGPEAPKESRNLRNMLLVLLGVEYWLAVLFGLIGLLPLMVKPDAPQLSVMTLTMVSLVVTIIFILAIILIAARSGQGGWRLSGAGNQNPAMAKPALVGDRTPDECWKGGIIYYNPNDPALWVEKRFGIGWTFNMANPRAWLVLGIILSFSVGTAVFGIIMARK